MARNTDIKLPILCDGQGQTTLGRLILRTQCGAQPMFHQPSLLMRVALQGSQVWIVPMVRGKWCYRSHSRSGLDSTSSRQLTRESLVVKLCGCVRCWLRRIAWVDTEFTSAKVSRWLLANVSTVVDTFDKRYRYRYRQCYLKVSLTTTLHSILLLTVKNIPVEYTSLCNIHKIHFLIRCLEQLFKSVNNLTVITIKETRFTLQPAVAFVILITGPPTHSVGGQYCFALWRLSSQSVHICNTLRHNVTHQGTARGGPVVLRPVRATSCFILML